MDIITDHTASAAHGSGADTTAHIGAYITVLTGVHGHIAHGATTDIMTHGITEVTGEDTMEVTGAGMTHGTTTITTAAGMTHITTTIMVGLYTSSEAVTGKTDTSVFALTPSLTAHSQAAIQEDHQTGRQAR